MKKRVCILQNGLARGGTDTFVVNLCKSINKEKFEITVVNPSDNPGSLVQEPDVLAAGASIIHTHPLNGFKGKLIHFWKLYKLLKQGHYDVFQTNIDLFNGPNLFVAWLARVPLRCCHSHNTQQQKEIVKGRSFTLACYQSMMRWMCWHFSNRRCGCSKEAMDFLYKKYPWKQTDYPSVVYNGIEIEKFRQSQFNINRKKTELGLSAKHNILTVGQIIPQKNPLFIASIVKEICIVREDVDFVWVGIGNMEKEVKTLINKWGINKRVHFLGRRDDVPDVMRSCDVFLLPSLFEGLGIVLIEAQAAGMQCIASENIPKLANCGAVEFMPLTETSTTWAEAILDIIGGNRKMIVDETQLQNFSVKHMAEQMEKVFNS